MTLILRTLMPPEFVVRVQNSLPKGGPYTDPAGNRFGYGIFWTRIVNESAFPLELTINFSCRFIRNFPSV